MKRGKHRRPRRGRPTQEAREPGPPRSSSTLSGKQTISQDNHDSNVGQRDARDLPREIHPDDHEDEAAT